MAPFVKSSLDLAVVKEFLEPEFCSGHAMSRYLTPQTPILSKLAKTIHLVFYL